MSRRIVIAGLFGAVVVAAFLFSLLLAVGPGGGSAVADEPPPLPGEDDADLPPLPDVTPTPTLSTIETQLAGCAGNYQAVYGFDNVSKAFSRFFPGRPTISTLTEMQIGAGYMVLVSADCTLTNNSSTWTLSTGWNFIGWR